MTTPTPPPRMFAEWLAEAVRLFPDGRPGIIASHVARRAYAAGAEAGAQEERNACVEWLARHLYPQAAERLLNARTPKPPSLREQALELLLELPITDEQRALMTQAVTRGQP